MKKLKKGFTLVELVIVIAVIAVLAAVLIPTFTGIVQRAKVSNDTSLVKSLNTTMAEVDVQDRPTSVAEAIEVVEADGIKLSKLTATANGYNIVYDLEQNRFALLDGKNNVAYQDPNKDEIDTSKLYKLWKIIQPNQSANDKTFSMFLAGDNRTGTLNISTGVEVGENTGITQINYTNIGAAQNVVINTNNMWGTLTINAPSDEVEHHGIIGDLNIIAVKKGTYNEFGRVGGIAHLTYGAIKVNNGAELTTLVATPANNNANDVVLEVTNGGVVGTLIAFNSDVSNALNNSGVKHSEVVNPGDNPQQVIENTLNSVAYILHQNTRTYYNSFDGACNAAATNDTVVVLRDYQYSAALKSTLVEIGTNKNVTLDLNGKIIQAVLDNSESITMFNVKGNLTIMDSTASENGIGSGSIETSVAYTADPWKVSAAVIKPQAGSSLIVNSGKLINRGGSGSYVIDTYQGSTTTINNGYIEGTQYNAIRMFCNSTTQTNTLTVNNGTFKAHYNCIWLQNPNGNANVATLTINNGTFMSEDDYDISIAMEWGTCYNYSAMTITINSGLYSTGIYLEYDCWNNSNENAATLSISNLLDSQVTKGTEDWKTAS